MRSSCRVNNPKLVDKVWNVFKDASAKKPNTNGVKNGLSVTEETTNNSNKKTNSENVQEGHSEADKNSTNETAKLNKREKKELRKEKQSKKSKKDKNIPHDNTKSGTKRKLDEEEELEPNLETAEPKKKKKRKGDDSVVEGEEQQVIETKKSKKKKEKDNTQESTFTTNGNHIRGEENEEQTETQSKSAFKWSVAINKVLVDAPEEGLKMSKLQRKVLSLYYAFHGDATNVKTKEELSIILHKKLNKKNKFVMYKDKVKLQK